MSNIIQIKRGTSDKINTANLKNGELAIDTTNHILYYGNDNEKFPIIAPQANNLKGEVNTIPYQSALNTTSFFSIGEGFLEYNNNNKFSWIPTIPVSKGGTGASTAAQALITLIGNQQIGSTSQPIFWNGSSFDVGDDLNNLNKYEIKENKTQTLNATSSNIEYPSAKAVYDAIQKDSIIYTKTLTAVPWSNHTDNQFNIYIKRQGAVVSIIIRAIFTPDNGVNAWATLSENQLPEGYRPTQPIRETINHVVGGKVESGITVFELQTDGKWKFLTNASGKKERSCFMTYITGDNYPTNYD